MQNGAQLYFVSLVKANRSILLTAIKTMIQAGFFVLVPMYFSDVDATIVILTFSLAAVASPVAALGSQFQIITAFAKNDLEKLPLYVKIFSFGFVTILSLVFVISLFYSQVIDRSIIPFIGLFLVCNYARLYGDSYMQGSGKFDLMQIAYVGFWGIKLTMVYLFFQLFGETTFTYLALIEVLLSLPWIIYFLMSCRRCQWYGNRISWPVIKSGITATGASLTRGAWLEIDKLVLPLILTKSAYVEYSLIARVFTVGLVLVTAHVSSITPRIISSNNGMPSNFFLEGRMQVILSIAAMALGFSVSGFLYPNLFGQIVIIGSIFILALPAFYLSSISLDFIFYRIGVFERLCLNVIGLFIVSCSILLVNFNQALWMAPAGFTISFLVTMALSLNLIHKRIK